MHAPGCAEGVPGLLGGAEACHPPPPRIFCVISCIPATVSPFILSSFLCFYSSWGKFTGVFIFMS